MSAMATAVLQAQREPPVMVMDPPQWVISDTHLGHADILTYCPWRQTWARDLAEHDAASMSAWRLAVAPTDVVLHLGDVALGPRDDLAGYRSRLPGRIVVVRGNHDRSRAAMREAGFDVVVSSLRIDSGGHAWVCRHDPASFSVPEAAASVRLLHGHCHGNGVDPRVPVAVRDKAFDCSLDALRSIGPVPWSQIAGLA